MSLGSAGASKKLRQIMRATDLFLMASRPRKRLAVLFLKRCVFAVSAEQN